MKLHLFLITLLPFSPVAQAETYRCHLDANPKRGFYANFDIELDPTSGGEMRLVANGNVRILGRISQVTLVGRDNRAERPAFDLTLRSLSEPDISGIRPENIERVSAIQSFRVSTRDNEDFLVYRLFAGTAQPGGSFTYNSASSACLPTHP